MKVTTTVATVSTAIVFASASPLSKSDPHMDRARIARPSISPALAQNTTHLTGFTTLVNPSVEAVTTPPPHAAEEALNSTAHMSPSELNTTAISQRDLIIENPTGGGPGGAFPFYYDFKVCNSQCNYDWFGCQHPGHITRFSGIGLPGAVNTLGTECTFVQTWTNLPMEACSEPNGRGTCTPLLKTENGVPRQFDGTEPPVEGEGVFCWPVPGPPPPAPKSEEKFWEKYGTHGLTPAIPPQVMQCVTRGTDSIRFMGGGKLPPAQAEYMNKLERENGLDPYWAGNPGM